QFSYLGGVSYDPTVTVPPEKIGAFYNSANSAVGTIYMEKSGSPLAGIATTNYMAAANGVSGLRISLAPTNKTLPMTTG
ncbi:MAG: hypothetical protein WCO89_11025, partial [Syntrophus sp. (in: bacteria)]